MRIYPGAVALQHALVYLLGWLLVCGIRIHYLPQVASCYHYEPLLQLPFCASLTARAEANATAINNPVTAFVAENETTIVTAVSRSGCEQRRRCSAIASPI